MGTQAWNIADGFTKIKILRILIELDLYETIAVFGKKDLEEMINFSDIPYRRVEGFERMLFSMRQLISNCLFAIKKDEDKKRINEFNIRIEGIEKFKDGIATEIKNELTKEVELQINEEHFSKCFNILREIKQEVNFPINHAGLIFRAGDELNLDDFMRSVEEGEL